MQSFNEYELALIEKGLARIYRGRLIPVMRGGAEDDAPIFPAVPADLAAATDETLQAFVDEAMEAIDAVAADPLSFVSETFSSADLRAAMVSAVESVESANAEITRRATGADADAELAASVAELAARATASTEEAEPEPEPDPEPEAEPEAEPAVEPEPATEPEPTAAIVAAAARRPAPLPRPTAARRARATETQEIALTAAAGLTDVPLGTEFPDLLEVARAMIRRRHQFGLIAEGASGQEPIARADWSHLYPAERVLGGDIEANSALIASVVNEIDIRKEMDRRKNGSPNGLVASGGLCAPVTPYYQLAMISTSGRPVRGSLPSFSADRGGIRFARPAALSAITTGVGEITAAFDAQGGTFATKTCQTISCPAFTEQDVETIFHCLQFGNLGARAFPELVAQWNNLVLAAWARTAESHLLTQMVAASTAVTAQNLGLGASGALLGQILAASNAMRNRHRMDPEAVLRLMIPDWTLDLLISDIIRGQFQRFDTDEAKMTAFLRSFDIEPTFYMDGASGKAQVFGTQSAGALLPFPSTVNWLLFPEGSFLYLDGGSLELGLVRDSVLNKTNDFQIFGESFEDVAFVGVESISVVSTVCDSGTVAAARATVCPIDYIHNT